MRRALRLARSGYCPPNPHVGCVIVRQGQIVGEGATERVGGAHAEIVALRAAGEAAREATVFTTLEPCNHQGRTGPCSVALIEAGVARVVYATGDPFPKAAGGADRLRANGIEVEAGLLREQAEEVHRAFLHFARTGRPFVVVKAAATLDGRIALPSGESRWITGLAARREGHRLRAELGAILVGRGTVEADDPHLTARIPGVTDPPVRIVLDASGKLSGDHRVFDAAAPTWRVGRGGAFELRPTPEGEIDLVALVDELGRRGLTGILIEGGGKTTAGFFRAGLVDRIELFLAPKLFGAGPSWIEGALTELVADTPEFSLLRTQRIGQDLQLTYSKGEGVPDERSSPRPRGEVVRRIGGGSQQAPSVAPRHLALEAGEGS